MSQIHLIYSGQVQGVGFRHSVKQLAKLLPITGWVRNNPNGTVEVVAEGSDKDLESFVLRISQSHLQNYIEDVEKSWEKAIKSYTKFSVIP